MPTKRFALLVVGLASFLLALEATVRIEDWIRYGTPPFVNALSQSDLIATDSLGAHGKANGRFRKWTLDSLGFRGPDVPRLPPPGVVRVVVTGASETFGLVEDSGKEFPRQLQDSLNTRVGQLPKSCPIPVRFEVVNAALPGMYLPTAIEDVQGRLAAISPTAVLFYPSPPQYLDLDRPRAYARNTTTSGWADRLRPFFPRSLGTLRETIKGLLPSSISMALRRAEIARVVRSHPPGWQFTSVPEDRLAALESDLRQLVGTIRAIGAAPILATHANAFGLHPERRDDELLLSWQRYSPRATGATIIAFDSAANERVARVAADSNVLLVRVDSALYRSGSEGVFGDYVHFTNFGAALVAGAAAQPILEAFGPRLATCSMDQAVEPSPADTTPSPTATAR